MLPGTDENASYISKNNEMSHTINNNNKESEKADAPEITDTLNFPYKFGQP